MQGGWLVNAMINRADHMDGFTIIQNETLRDERLSFEARGFLAYLLTMADAWDFSIKGLAAQAGVPERTVMRLSKELKEAGYLQQKSNRDERGVIAGWEWTISETSTLRENHTVDNPECGEPTLWQTHTAAQPHCGKSAPIRNTIYKEIPSKKNNHTEKKSKTPARKFIPPTLEEVSAYCQERHNTVNPVQFISYYESNGWKVGRNSMKSWKAAVITWEQREKTSKGRAIAEPLQASGEQETPLQRLTRLAVERAEGGST